MRMALLSFQNLGCDVVGSTANSSFALAIELQFGCKAEVTNFHLHLVVEEEISKLEISVDDSVAVQVLNCSADLVNVALHFKFVQAFASSKQFVEGLVLAQLKEDVDVLCVFEEVFEAYDVVVVERAVDFDF